MTVHWGIADPAAVDGREADKSAVFLEAFNELQHGISTFVNLPFE
jgi:arsenate reductase